MSVPAAPVIRAYVLSKGKVAIRFRAVDGATSYNLYRGSVRGDANAVGRNEKQTVTVDATGGTFKITYAGQQTAAIAFDALPAAVQTALEALSNIAVGDVSVTGTAKNHTIEFTGLLARTNVAQVTCDSTSLTGGTHTATPATTVAGIGPVSSSISDGNVQTLAVGTRGVYMLRAVNAEGEGPASNAVSLANLDFTDHSVGLH